MSCRRSGPPPKMRAPRRKMIVVSSDDEEDRQPALKTVKKEPKEPKIVVKKEPLDVPSQEVQFRQKVIKQEKDVQPAPSRELLELRQKVARLEREKQGAFRITNEAHARVAFLENLLDKKPKIDDIPIKKPTPPVDNASKKLVDELQKKVYELTCKLAESCGEASQLREQLRQANEDGMSDRIKLTDASARLQEATRKEEYSSKIRYEKSQEIMALKMEVAGWKKFTEASTKLGDAREENTTHVAALQKQLEMERSFAIEGQLKDREKIGLLAYRLSLYEGWPLYKSRMRSAACQTVAISSKPEDELQKKLNDALKQLEEMRRAAEFHQTARDAHVSATFTKQHNEPARDAHITATYLDIKEYVHRERMKIDSENRISTNILAVLPLSNSPKSIHYSLAFDQLKAKFEDTVYDEDSSQRYKQAVENETLYCASCCKMWRGEQIMAHFLSPQHNETALTANAVISMYAFGYWMSKLESIQKPIVATASSSVMSGSSKGIEEGEVVEQ